MVPPFFDNKNKHLVPLQGTWQYFVCSIKNGMIPIWNKRPKVKIARTRYFKYLQFELTSI